MLVRDPQEELHDTKLYKTLANISPEFAGRIDVFVSKIAPILATTIRHFPYYTRHDAHHGFRVLRHRKIDSTRLPPHGNLAFAWRNRVISPSPLLPIRMTWA